MASVHELQERISAENASYEVNLQNIRQMLNDAQKEVFSLEQAKQQLLENRQKFEIDNGDLLEQCSALAQMHLVPTATSGAASMDQQQLAVMRKRAKEMKMLHRLTIEAAPAPLPCPPPKLVAHVDPTPKETEKKKKEGGLFGMFSSKMKEVLTTDEDRRQEANAKALSESDPSQLICRLEARLTPAHEPLGPMDAACIAGRGKEADAAVLRFTLIAEQREDGTAQYPHDLCALITTTFQRHLDDAMKEAAGTIESETVKSVAETAVDSVEKHHLSPLDHLMGTPTTSGDPSPQKSPIPDGLKDQKTLANVLRQIRGVVRVGPDPSEIPLPGEDDRPRKAYRFIVEVSLQRAEKDSPGADTTEKLANDLAQAIEEEISTNATVKTSGVTRRDVEDRTRRAAYVLAILAQQHAQAAAEFTVTSSALWPDEDQSPTPTPPMTPAQKLAADLAKASGKATPVKASEEGTSNLDDIERTADRVQRKMRELVRSRAALSSALDGAKNQVDVDEIVDHLQPSIETCVNEVVLPTVRRTIHPKPEDLTLAPSASSTPPPSAPASPATGAAPAVIHAHASHVPPKIAAVNPLLIEVLNVPREIAKRSLHAAFDAMSRDGESVSVSASKAKVTAALAIYDELHFDLEQLKYGTPGQRRRAAICTRYIENIMQDFATVRGSQLTSKLLHFARQHEDKKNAIPIHAVADIAAAVLDSFEKAQAQKKADKRRGMQSIATLLQGWDFRLCTCDRLRPVEFSWYIGDATELLNKGRSNAASSATAQQQQQSTGNSVLPAAPPVRCTVSAALRPIGAGATEFPCEEMHRNPRPKGYPKNYNCPCGNHREKVKFWVLSTLSKAAALAESKLTEVTAEATQQTTATTQ